MTLTYYYYGCNAAMVDTYNYICGDCQAKDEMMYRKIMDVQREFNLPKRESPTESYYEFQRYNLDPDLEVDEGL